MQVTGLVTKLNMKTKTAAGKPMRSPAYSILLDDTTWYNFGFDTPNCGEGDVITFDATESTYGLEAKFSSVKVETGGATASPSASTAVAKADNRQESIVYQNSMSHAVNIVSLALEYEAVSLPTKKADRLPALEAMVQEVARNIAVISIAPDYASFSTDSTDTAVPEDE